MIEQFGLLTAKQAATYKLPPDAQLYMDMGGQLMPIKVVGQMVFKTVSTVAATNGRRHWAMRGDDPLVVAKINLTGADAAAIIQQAVRIESERALMCREPEPAPAGVSAF
jgi:hypothetical protein